MTRTASTAQTTETVNGATTTITFTLDVELAGETRTVEFTGYRRIRPDGTTWTTGADSDYIAAGRIGRGTKAWRVALVAWERDGVWTFNGQCTNANNRQTQLIGWADAHEGKSSGSKHAGCYAIR